MAIYKASLAPYLQLGYPPKQLGLPSLEAPGRDEHLWEFPPQGPTAREALLFSMATEEVPSTLSQEKSCLPKRSSMYFHVWWWEGNKTQLTLGGSLTARWLSQLFGWSFDVGLERGDV